MTADLRRAADLLSQAAALETEAASLVWRHVRVERRENCPVYVNDAVYQAACAMPGDAARRARSLVVAAMGER